jgi:hypothetical protein
MHLIFTFQNVLGSWMAAAMICTLTTISENCRVVVLTFPGQTAGLMRLMTNGPKKGDDEIIHHRS